MAAIDFDILFHNDDSGLECCEDCGERHKREERRKCGLIFTDIVIKMLNDNMFSMIVQP